MSSAPTSWKDHAAAATHRAATSEEKVALLREGIKQALANMHSDVSAHLIMADLFALYEVTA